MTEKGCKHMRKPFIDLEDSDICIPVSNNMAMDSNGNLLMRMSDSLAMDMESGDLHITSGWDHDDDDEW